MTDSPPADNPIDSELEKLEIDSESKRVEFSNLTTDVLKVIIEKSELKERLILRKVSRGLRDLVDQQKSIFTHINVTCHDDHIKCSYNGNLAIYADENSEIEKLIICSKDFEKTTFSDLKFAIADPSTKLDFFGFDFRFKFRDCQLRSEHDMVARCFKSIQAILSSLSHQVSVEVLSVRADKSLTILPYLKPGVLRRIEISEMRSEINKIAELDQWKQAEELYMREGFHMFYYEHFAHFKRLNLYAYMFSLPELLRLRTLMSISQNLELCVIDTKNGFKRDLWELDSEDIMDDLGEPTDPPKFNLRHHQIPGSNQYLEFALRPCMESLIITKLTC